MKLFWIRVIYCVIFTKVSRCQVANFSFPENFLIGTATASYQVEGAWNISDKGENIWDHFTHNKPEAIADRSNGDIACDSYHKYEEDVQWITELGLDYYRFSISWARVLPNGFADTVSEEGMLYYKNLIQALLANKIKPVVTIYHWDHPQVLENLGGWTNELMVEWFADYARIIFRELGPFVETFITINEPTIFCEGAYNSGAAAPGKVLKSIGYYLCVHNVLKAHATAYHIYDEEFRPAQQGKVGLTTHCSGWVSGDNTSPASIEQSFLFECGWIMHPLYIGDYPEIMKTRIAKISKLEGYPSSRLPQFSEGWITYINGTSDFFGLNHYSSSMPVFDPDEELGIYNSDSGIIRTIDPSWPVASAAWARVVPVGFGNLLRTIRDQYDNPPLFVFENGYSDNGELDDYNRIDFYYKYLTELLIAVQRDGCKVIAYTIWSLLDNFEWSSGYTARYGIIKVDFNSPDRTRTAKLSTSWWQEVVRTRILQEVPTNNTGRYQSRSNLALAEENK